MSEHKQWAQDAFVGLQTVIVPSFNADFSDLSEAGIRLDVRRSIEHGFFGALCACDAGLTLAENKRFVEIVAEEAGDRLITGPSLFVDSEADMLELAAHAEAAGMRFALLGFPLLFNPEDQDAVYRYARRLCDATGLGMVLPVHPERVDFSHLDESGVALDAYQRLLEVDNVVAVLVQSSEPGLISECFQRYRKQVPVAASFFGALPMLTRNWGMQWAGDWAYESVQSPSRPYAVELFELLRAGRQDAAMRLYWDLAPGLATLGHVRAAFATGGVDHFHLRKYLQWCVGGNGGLTREPQMNLLQRQRNEIREAYQAMGISPTADADENFLRGRANYLATVD